eukprot:GHVL01001785.1.p1 GENE.GHVL01001785.1~~GHVL01001785.1.p1  ORF type:complete len:777 (-),score=172.25 GHVL01001785.1:310-2550(-)
MNDLRLRRHDRKNGKYDQQVGSSNRKHAMNDQLLKKSDEYQRGRSNEELNKDGEDKIKNAYQRGTFQHEKNKYVQELCKNRNLKNGYQENDINRHQESRVLEEQYMYDESQDDSHHVEDCYDPHHNNDQSLSRSDQQQPKNGIEHARSYDGLIRYNQQLGSNDLKKRINRRLARLDQETKLCERRLSRNNRTPRKVNEVNENNDNDQTINLLIKNKNSHEDVMNGLRLRKLYRKNGKYDQQVENSDQQHAMNGERLSRSDHYQRCISDEELDNVGEDNGSIEHENSKSIQNIIIDTHDIDIVEKENGINSQHHNKVVHNDQQEQVIENRISQHTIEPRTRKIVQELEKNDEENKIYQEKLEKNDEENKIYIEELEKNDEENKIYKEKLEKNDEENKIYQEELQKNDEENKIYKENHQHERSDEELDKVDERQNRINQRQAKINHQKSEYVQEHLNTELVKVEQKNYRKTEHWGSDEEENYQKTELWGNDEQPVDQSRITRHECKVKPIKNKFLQKLSNNENNKVDQFEKKNNNRKDENMENNGFLKKNNILEENSCIQNRNNGRRDTSVTRLIRSVQRLMNYEENGQRYLEENHRTYNSFNKKNNNQVQNCRITDIWTEGVLNESSAYCGVYFCYDDPRNTIYKLGGVPQNILRAQLSSIKTALLIMRDNDIYLRIHTDSLYIKQLLTKRSSGQYRDNYDLIHYILYLMHERGNKIEYIWTQNDIKAYVQRTKIQDTVSDVVCCFI